MGEHIRYHDEFEQGSLQWHQARCGLLTASEMGLIMTAKTLKAASNEKERTHLYELLAQRISKHVEPGYIGEAMLRGYEDEADARADYERLFAPVEQVGFVTNSRWGFTLGYSPDGLVGDDGLIECKSRKQKFQVQTIVECVAAGTVPEEFLLQVQTGLLVTERSWLDFMSRCGGLPMPVIRVYPDPVVHAAILEAASAFEKRLSEKFDAFTAALTSGARFVPTERRVDQEMFV